MKTIIIATSSLLFLAACSSESKTVLLKTEKGKKEVSKEEVVPDRMATIEISGMTCEAGCGGTIRKELKATGGVSRVQYDFVEGREVQTAKVSFDKDKVTLDQMLKIITTINEKQFTVGKTSSEAVNDVSTTSTEPSPSKETVEKVSMSETQIEMPNLIGILSDII
jgi:copper chaperone CopZ